MANKDASIYGRLKAGYKEDLRTVQMSAMENESIPQYLGQLMGEREWNESDTEANKKFIHVDAYERFKDTDCLVLVGRTGTGKSSLLKKMEYDVKRETVPAYKDVVFIDLQDYIRQLSDYGNIDGTQRTYSDLESNLSNFVSLSIMRHIVFNSGELYPENEIKGIRKYLEEHHIQKETDLGAILSGYAEKISNEHISTALHTINMLKEISRYMFGVGFEEAKSTMKSLFKMQKMLVLIDAMENYDFNDVASIVIVKALMNVTFGYFSKNETICIKISLPSELYSILNEQIPAKQIGNTVFIEWRYKDLIKFIAMRCFYLFTESEWSSKFRKLQLNNFNYQQLASDYGTAKKLLLSFLPETCSASINLSFDTLSYIIRHTQKKPRQLMIIFESIIHKIIQYENIFYFMNNQSKLKERIHYVQVSLISDCLNMYATTYESIVVICSRILQNRKYSMSDEELNEYIERIKSTLKSIQLSKNDIKQVLIQSGILGTYIDEDIHYIDKGNNYFKNPNIIKIIPVKYEYQIKGRLPYNEGSIYVIHPMCYEYYRTIVDYNCLIYPECDDDSDETFDYFISSKDITTS